MFADAGVGLFTKFLFTVHTHTQFVLTLEYNADKLEQIQIVLCVLNLYSRAQMSFFGGPNPMSSGIQAYIRIRKHCTQNKQRGVLNA
jgi:hypothetical protein